MHGFSVVIPISKHTTTVDFQWKPLFDFQTDYIKRSYMIDDFQLEQYTSKKFLKDKLWINHDLFFIATEGLITNIDILCEKYQVDNYADLIIAMHNYSNTFFKDFTGNFTEFFYNKKTKAYTIFNNHTGTKKLFIYHDENYITLSTDLYTLSKTLDTEAAYLLLTSGFMHDDFTLIKEVKQITAGEYVVISDKEVSKQSYFHLKVIQENTDSEEEIINNLDVLFKEAIRLEFDVDKKHGSTPLTTLSGGLDSRMVALMAHDLNYSNQEFLNFSEKVFADEVIAKDIARAYRTKIHQIQLTPEGLLAIDDVIAVNDGLTIYSGASSAFESIKKMTTTQVGLVHTAILGDGFMGSYQNSKLETRSHLSDGGYSNALIKKATAVLRNSIVKHQNEELYKFYNRAYLGINNGFLFFDLLGASMSPFTYPPFIRYSFSIPRKLKYNRKIYIDWIKKKHPSCAKFIWEGIGGKPTNNLLVRQYYRNKRAIIRRLPISSMWKNNMNPEQIWYDENPAVKNYLDNYFKKHINKFEFHKELMEDMTMLYTTGNITEKTQVLTLLGAYKLLFE